MPGKQKMNKKDKNTQWGYVVGLKLAIKSIYSEYPVFTQLINIFFSSCERSPLGGIR